MPSAGDLSRSLVDAAAEAIGNTICAHHEDVGLVSCTRCDAGAAVAAVLETLAARTDAQKMMFDSAWLRRLAVEARTED